MQLLPSFSFRQFFKTLGILTAYILAGNCSPVYSIGVRGALTQPMSVDCILKAAQTTEGVQHVLIHQKKAKEGEGILQTVDEIIDPPTTYLVTTIDQQDAQIEQRPLKDGRAILWVGRQGIGIKPSQHTIEAAQVFHIRLSSHIAEVCKGRYSDMTCVPVSEACQKLVNPIPSS